MSVPIYKVNHIINDKIDTIYIFNGKNKKKSNEEINLNSFFSEKEIQNIKNNDIKIKYSEQQIHSDDSIGMIKLKIISEFKKSISTEEIYLYCQKIESFNSVSIYQTLTQNKKISLTKVRLNLFISNIISDINGNKFEYNVSKDVYDYDDIVSMNLDNKQFIVNKVLGQKFFMIENEYPFVCNPFDVEIYDSFLERNARKSLTTLNSHLLLNSGEIVDNNIYLCLAKDVLEFDEQKNILQSLTLKIYYPFLFSKNINNIEELNESKNELIKNNDKLLDQNTLEYFKTIDMFYDIYSLRKNELNYVKKGIKYIKAVIKPVYNINIPLEVIFKLLHADKNNPLIKYNPSSRQENIFRLYTDKIATDGRKIPYLKKSLIFKIIKNIGKTKSVSVYIENSKDYDLYQLICEFDENGYTTIQAELKNAVEENKINELFIENINPILQEISSILQQSGYKISLFENIKSDNIEIRQLTYQTQIKIKTSINLDLYKGCISSVFTNETGIFKKDIHLRFKRVSNFNKVTSQEAFILEKRDDGLRGDEIVEALLDNFSDDLNRKDAEDLVRKMVNQIQVEMGFRKTDIKIKDNPGFKTILLLDKLTGILTINVENINDIEYLSTIPIYLDSMIRITQDKKSTKFPTKEIDNICSSGEKEEVKILDIISPVESIKSEMEIPSIDDENSEIITYKKISETSESDQEDKGKNAFDLFFDEDEIESEESIPSEDFKGGVIKSSKGNTENNENENYSDQNNDQNNDLNNEESIINIDNLSLKKKDPYFETRIEKLDPVLIIKEDSKEYNSYSRVCSSSERRQPVILTDKELDKINKEHPNFLQEEDVIRYGSDPNKQFNYICPRYWCLKNNTIVDPKDLEEVIVNGKKELKSRNCGYVLPEDAKQVKPGYYVYEFYKPKPGKKNYKKYPGFQVDKHPDGYCLPCCFDKYNTIGRLTANKKCIQNKTENTIEEDKEIKENTLEKTSNKSTKEDEYIKGPDKFPLSPGKWGYLPPQIESIMKTVNADCFISKTNTNIKPNHPCLLRHGVEINDKQSFISCISDLLFFYKKDINEETGISKVTKILTIKEMKEKIIDILEIDKFITYQNGNLVNDFKSSFENINNNKLIDFEKYKNSKLYSKINFTNEEEMLYFKNVISAFENFIYYLKDDSTIIDHTYLWDIVCKPNKKLFSKGINLIIFKIPNDDITNNVDLICPTNHYSNELYDSRKPTVFLMKEDNYYEPIYSYMDKNNKILIAKDFKEYDPHLPQNIRTIFNEVIKPFVSVICKPLDSIPNIYKSPRAPLLSDLIQKLTKYDYNITKMVMNFNNKIIGVISNSISNLNLSVFIPCYPSSYDEYFTNSFEFVFMTDLSLWNNYEDTVSFLNKLYNKSKKKNLVPEIPCKPILKVVEDSIIVGIITETNQFIQINPPIPELDISPEFNLPSLTNNDYLVKKKDKYILSDSIITTSQKYDVERVEYIKKIKYETQFYNVFRNTIRILLNDYSNIKLREKIESEMLKDYIIYSQKLQNIIKLLKELVSNKIKFIGDSNYYKLIDEVSTCIIKDKKSCLKSPNLCMLSETGELANEGLCGLILPKQNLITNKDNENIYFGKMADELIRYNRIKSYILQPQTFLTFGNIGYNLRDDEIIMLQSLLTQDYFESLVPAILNKYVKYNSHDEAEPIVTQSYDNLAETIKSSETEKCNKTSNTKISSSKWQDCFPTNFGELSYSKTTSCTFEVIIDIIEKIKGEKITVNNITKILFEEYKKYLSDFGEKIVDILILEGKKYLGNKVKNNALSFSDLIFNNNYFLTPLDLWFIVNKFKIPTIFISSRNLLQTNYEKNLFIAYAESSDIYENKFCFILIPGLASENIPGYKIIQNNKKEIFISLNDISSECKINIEKEIENKITIDEYLSNFIKMYKKKIPLLIEDDEVIIKPKKIKKKLIIDESEEVINPIPIEEEIVIKPKKTKKTKKIIIKGKTGGNITRKIKKSKF